MTNFTLADLSQLRRPPRHRLFFGLPCLTSPDEAKKRVGIHHCKVIQNSWWLNEPIRNHMIIKLDHIPQGVGDNTT